MLFVSFFELLYIDNMHIIIINRFRSFFYYCENFSKHFFVNLRGNLKGDDKIITHSYIIFKILLNNKKNKF